MNPDNIKVTSGRDTNYKANDVKSRPTANPKSRKDFKEVLRKSKEDEDDDDGTAKEIIEETDGTIAQVLEGNVKKKAPPSLFDLTSTSKKIESPYDRMNSSSEKMIGNVMEKPKEGLANGKIEDTFLKEKPVAITDKKPLRTQSPAQMYSQLTESKKMPKEDLVNFDADVLPYKDKFTTRFATEQTDLSSINPLAAAAHQQPSVNLAAGAEKPVIPASHIQEIINQMIEKVAEIKNTGTTETVITLKNPPGFEGATIVVTAFDHAKNEFNITIENLTQAAKHLVDQQSNRDSLLSSLQQKGYAVHILTTTTLDETRPIIAQLASEEQGRGRQNEEQGQGKQQRRQGNQG